MSYNDLCSSLPLKPWLKGGFELINSNNYLLQLTIADNQNVNSEFETNVLFNTVNPNNNILRGGASANDYNSGVWSPSFTGNTNLQVGDLISITVNLYVTATLATTFTLLLSYGSITELQGTQLITTNGNLFGEVIVPISSLSDQLTVQVGASATGGVLNAGLFGYPSTYIIIKKVQ